jgi:hypothetical protein
MKHAISGLKMSAIQRGTIEKRSLSWPWSIVALEHLGFLRIAEALAARTGQLLAVEVSVPAAGWP